MTSRSRRHHRASSCRMTHWSVKNTRKLEKEEANLKTVLIYNFGTQQTPVVFIARNRHVNQNQMVFLFATARALKRCLFAMISSGVHAAICPILSMAHNSARIQFIHDTLLSCAGGESSATARISRTAIESATQNVPKQSPVATDSSVVASYSYRVFLH